MSNYPHNFPNAAELNFMLMLTSKILTDLKSGKIHSQNTITTELVSLLTGHLEALQNIQKSFVFPSVRTPVEHLGKFPLTTTTFSIEKTHKELIQKLITFSRFIKGAPLNSTFGQGDSDTPHTFAWKAIIVKTYQRQFKIDLTHINVWVDFDSNHPKAEEGSIYLREESLVGDLRGKANRVMQTLHISALPLRPHLGNGSGFSWSYQFWQSTSAQFINYEHPGESDSSTSSSSGDQ